MSKATAPDQLLNLKFLMLFLQAMCCNCYVAVFYCMEQWMVKLDISPSWRGILLAMLAATVFLMRPLVTFWLDQQNKTWPMILSILGASLSLLCYPWVSSSFAIPAILSLRVIQGLALAIYSSCTVTMLVNCIPNGQSARGFALFSLTLLLPYAILPAIGESLIQIMGGEAQLFAYTSLLGLPALIMLIPLYKLMQTKSQNKPNLRAKTKRWHSLKLNQLGLVYFACFNFTLMTNQAIFFVKGLCQIIQAVPAYFFTTYTTTIIIVRLIGNTILDRLPRYPVIIITAAILALCILGMAYTEGVGLIPLAFGYGLAMALHYPLLAALVCDRSSLEERSVNSNLMMAAFDASAFLAPMLGGLVINFGFGYQGVFISAAICISLCGFSILIDSVIQKTQNLKLSN
ncbi:MAG: MFS transporter [Desulfovibrionaceae bacterium]|nr:MFS transporter [Desulfovibrionaceae bacterium]